MKVKKLNRDSISNIISSEAAYLLEACGCGGGHPRYMHDEETSLGDPIMLATGDDANDEYEDHGGKMLSKDEALDLVSMIAKRTSCPVTREILMAAVDMIHHKMGHDGESVSVIDAIV